MDTKLLKQKILDLAIHGKLVPQNPNDESATVLLEKIRAEKAEKIKKGELKANKKDSYIFVGDDNRHYEKFADGTVKDIEDEIPFEVPESWAWCKMKEILDISSAKRVLQEDWKDSGIPFYRAREIAQLSNGEIVKDDLFITNELYESLKENYGVPQPEDLMVSAVGTIGKTYIVKETDCFYYKDASVLRFAKRLHDINSSFLKLWIESDFIQAQMYAHSNGTTVDTITISTAQEYYFPLPPINEQALIVNEIERLFVLINSIESDKIDLQTAIKQTKSKILDLAIHGKLVPQDSSDEPASILLEKLRAEKEAKIKTGELKRDKNDSYIYKSTTDNCYYQKFADGSEEQADITSEIPNNWAWCCLGEISTKLKRGKSPTYTEKSSIMAFAQKCNQKDGPTTLEKALYIDEATLKKYPEEEKMQLNDIVINSTGTGTLGRVGIFDCSIPDGVVAVYPDSHVSSVRINPQLFAKYFYYFVKNKQSYLEEMGEGSTNQKELKIDTISNLIVPLPPLAEQKRIVEKIENAFAKLDQIAEQLA